MYTKKNRPRLRSFGLLLVALGLACLARPDAARAQERAAEAYQKAYEMVLDEEWNSASAALKDFLRQHPRTDWEDDARFWQCYVQEKAGGSDENAFACYQNFVNENDESTWVDDARSNMVQLAQRLARSGKRTYMTIIESMQTEGNEEVKLAALDALWQMGDERALDAVLNLYDNGASEQFRKKIIFALSQFDAPRAAVKLKDIALQDPNPTVRKEAIFWISQRGGPEVIPLLEEIAKQEDSVEVQKQIVFAYSEMGAPGVPRLIDIARTHPSQAVRKDAIFWLSQQGGPAVLDFFDDLINKSADVAVQKGLVFAFSEMGAPGVPRLINIARTHPSQAVRKDAIFWLSQQGGPAVLDFFDDLINKSDDVEVQKGLVFAFSEMGREGVPRLINIARTHRNAEIRKDAIFWLSQQGGPAVLDFFDDLINKSDDVAVQKGLVFAFSQLGEEGLPRLIDIAKSHNNPAIRKDAIFWLGQTDDPRAREALLDIVKGQD